MVSRFSGSAQEFDETRILGRSPENHKFGWWRPLALPSTVALLAPTASEGETLSPRASHRPSHWGLRENVIRDALTGFLAAWFSGRDRLQHDFLHLRGPLPVMA
jgi:hypothetical protein